MDRGYKNYLDLAGIIEVDCYAKALEDTARRAALYYYSPELNKWSSAEIYGPCYLYERHTQPTHSLFLRNSRNITSLVEPIGPDMQISSQSPFLFYDNGCGLIRSLRFDRASDCSRFSARINMIINEQKNREMMAAGDGPHVAEPNIYKNDAASRIKTTEILQKLAQSQSGGAFVVGKSANFSGTPNISLTPQLQSRISHLQQEKQQWCDGLPQMVAPGQRADQPYSRLSYIYNPWTMGARAYSPFMARNLSRTSQSEQASMPPEIKVAENSEELDSENAAPNESVSDNQPQDEDSQYSNFQTM